MASSSSSSTASSPTTTSRSSSPATSVSSISDSGEYEVDSKNGSVAGAETARRRARNYLYRGMKMDELDTQALDQLPPSMLVYPKKRHSRPEHYHFGFGVSLKQLYDYCVARDLVPKDWHGKLLYYTMMVNEAVDEIARRCGTKLYLQYIWNVEHEWVVARYSNYNWHHNIMPEHDEQLAADILQRELGICERARWYWQY
ncbi:hypothetical protein EWM64_g1978 [Hericium alpestre]|uniref:Uncharacterized protein n=1 Tax=Hericium alpestre TaxID=135208 RepID=A0A4Z0A6X6_9AGAM|nr:hypothetical protein EWM64_g1978 [Hericium alpestre]